MQEAQRHEDTSSLEVLLANIADQLEYHQAGELACEENAEALKHVNAALTALHRRTEDRIKRGVEGTSQR